VHCTYAAALNTTGLQDQPTITSRAMAAQLADYGHLVSKSTINNHRNQTCRCGNKTPTTPEQDEKQATNSAIGNNVPTSEHKPAAAPNVQEVVQQSGTSESADAYTITSEKAWGYNDFCEFIRAKGQDPEKVTFNWGVTTNPAGGFWNKINNVRFKSAAEAGNPAWPVIQQAQPVTVTIPQPAPAPYRPHKLALKSADHQIGYRRLADGTLDPFHDQRAMDIFVMVCAEYQPDKIQILGDFLDMPSQSRWAQEAGFALTTQKAFDTAHAWLAQLRAVAPNADIIIVEGNHDKRMQNFVETNALAAFGLRRANMPESWPTMSVPYLLRLDELDITYVDAYPAATDWDNDTTRNIHGTRANSKGSTTSQYIHELPHLNTWAGHTHRAEITHHQVMGPRGEPIRSYSANPGCMCRVDGAVPSVNGAIGANGSPAKVVEQWQQGIGFAYYDETESWPFVYRIIDGRTIIDGKQYAA